MSLTNPASPTVFLADSQAIKDITRPRSGVVQEVEVPKVFLGMFGPNVSTFEGDTWKHHRRITQRAFTEKNVQLVWSESVLVTEQLFRQWDKEHGQVVHISKLSHVTETLALMVISSAALGQRMSWRGEPNKLLPLGFKVSFQQAISTVSSSILLRHGGKLDQNVMGTKDVTLAPTENLFSVLMSASEEDMAAAGKGLADDEITGNAFLILFAGHETTAHALAFTMGLLAAYPEVQSEVYAQEYTDMSQLNMVTGAFMEPLRMYPVVPQLAKVAEEDVVVNVALNGPDSSKDDRANIAIPAGSIVIMSTLGIHYNPRYWPQPEEFQPSRFCEDYDKDAFLPFSTGRRVCLGKRFAETEATAVIATILAKYEISIDATKFPTIPGEAIHARRERLLRPYHFLTMVPENMPLVFTHR
ncbi:cytochrome P450 family protein [Ceratobasidium sp. AG-Ba]|nr:cytochrome P450 family protein [Ceratobasidium sp. AG-Ba]QRW12612.1 cytochrome P450 family protein [Ceratobasidium sp. AG-Ba]